MHKVINGMIKKLGKLLNDLEYKYKENRLILWSLDFKGGGLHQIFYKLTIEMVEKRSSDCIQLRSFFKQFGSPISY